MWQVERRLGSGGMGDVFLARTPEGQLVAVKIAPVQEEVRLLCKLRHPAIVSILGTSTTSAEIFGEDRGPCYWMEYVEGEDILSAAKKADPKRIAEWLTQVLEALQYLHSQGILHGDLSPANVLVDSSGRLKLVDFGVAGWIGSATVTNAATLAYMAPEKVDSKAIPASDLYSLGTIFYEAIAGKHPRAGCRSLQELIKKSPLPLDTSLNARIIDRMIRVDLQERFSQAGDVLEALRGGNLATSQGRGDYHAATMFGAEEHFAKIEKALTEIALIHPLVLVHGATGVGKSRFLKEIGFQAGLAGVSLLAHSGLEGRSPQELIPLLRLQDPTARPEKALLVLEWNDDRLRPDCRHFFQSLPQWRNVVEIRLKNLSRPETVQFLGGALGEHAAEAAGPLFDQTDGNPLLLTETTRFLLERRAQTGKPFSKEWLKDVKGLKSFEEILARRLGELAPEDMNILPWLAAAARPVPLNLLASLVLDETPLLRLRGLVAKGLVTQDDDGAYRPALPSLTEVILKFLSENELKAIHRHWLDILKGRLDDDAQKLHHALAAGDLSVIQNGSIAAAERLLQEGRREEAIALVHRALSFLKDPNDVSRLLRIKINCLNELGRFEAALELCDEVFGLSATDEPQPLRVVKYWLITGLNHQNLGNHAEAAARLRRCLKEGDPNDPAQRPFLVRAHSCLGTHELIAGRLPEARRCLEQGLELARPADRRRAEILRNLAEIHSLEGDAQGAHRLFDEAIRIYRSAQFEDGVFSTYLQEGNLALARRDDTAAEKAYREARNAAERHDNDTERALVEANLGVLARLEGNLHESLKLLSHAEDFFRLMGNRRKLAQHLGQLTMTEAEVGRFDKAAAHVQEIHALAKGIPEVLAIAKEAEDFLRGVRDGTGREEDRARLEAIYQRLPPELQVTFAERGDFKSFKPSKGPPSPAQAKKETEDIVGILDDLADLNRELLEEADMNRLLTRLMDRALGLAHAENGFLVLRNDEETAPLRGFSLAVARNITQKALEKSEYLPSLSAVRRALQTGLPVVTDNATEDAIFRNAKSIQLHQVKSLVALPVIGAEGVIGVFYLDHPFTQGLFEGETLAALRAFAGIAALALQKEKMIEELKAANRKLSDEIKSQASELGLIQRELKKSQMVLKNQYSEIIGRSPKMLEVLSRVDRITEAQIPVWIFGESGTGKESIARALHFNSSRQSKPFVSENCSALPENLLESELFGHKKGSFTGAVADKKGLFEFANGGTVFLDEIADMSLPLQGKLLRFLQEGEIRPVGSNQTLKVDVRVVSASNRHLGDLVKQGKFREDLFFRLNGVSVILPPLRERLEDLPLLVDHFLDRIATRQKKPKVKISQESMRILMGYGWPGNIRELQNALETASLFTEHGAIVPASLQSNASLMSKYVAPKEATPKATPKKAIPAELEKMLRIIKDECFNRSSAARKLGMSRRNFYTKLEKYGVPRDTQSLKEYVEQYVG